MYQVHFNTNSDNKKTGAMPVSTTTETTCPSTCPLKDAGCFADGGPLRLHWKAVTSGARGGLWDAFVSAVKMLPKGQLWRHNQAGDLPGDGTTIDAAALAALAHANRGRRGFTYTHYAPEGANAEAIRAANDAGFAINLSGNNVSHADRLADTGAGPVVAILPRDAPKVSFTPAGRRVVVCPEQSIPGMTCLTCGLCARIDRDYIIGFRAHGVRARKAEAIANQTI